MRRIFILQTCLNHVSIYTIMGYSTISPTFNVIIYPNPYYANKDRVIYFRGLTENAIIKIFTIVGELVKTIREPEDDGVADGIADWDTRNDAGEKVASGIYIYLITNSTGEKVTGKIGVIK
ncbi:MAG: T9SS type A sorting domain-containing protein [bacterium]